MIYLVVGLDRKSLTPWYENVGAADAAAARQLALAHAGRQGISLAVAAVVGPYSSVLPDGHD
jgi:hypothetical protein